MGSWGEGMLENDTALDYVDELEGRSKEEAHEAFENSMAWKLGCQILNRIFHSLLYHIGYNIRFIIFKTLPEPASYVRTSCRKFIILV